MPGCISCWTETLGLDDRERLDLEVGYRRFSRFNSAFSIHVSEIANGFASLLPSFQPYQAFQFTLSQWAGASVPTIVPWGLSFANGMTILGFLFARMYGLLPGRTGTIKGLSFGLFGWVFMNLIFFPVIGVLVSLL